MVIAEGIVKSCLLFSYVKIISFDYILKISPLQTRDMKYACYHIPSYTFPKKVIELRDGVICFKSKNEISFFSKDINCIALIIDIDKNPDYERVVLEFITTLNIFRYEYTSVQWLSQTDLKKGIKELELSNFIKENQLSPIDEYYYNEDFNDMEFHLIVYPRQNESFIKVFNKLLGLDSNTFLHRAIRFLAITISLKVTASKLFDNELMENSMLYQLLESMVTEYAPLSEEASKVCKSCNRPSNPSMNKRMIDFLKTKNQDSEDTIKMIKVIGGTRNKYFHALKGKSLSEYIDLVVKKVGKNNISFNEDLKYGDGANLGKHLLKAVLTYILVIELLEN